MMTSLGHNKIIYVAEVILADFSNLLFPLVPVWPAGGFDNSGSLADMGFSDSVGGNYNMV